MRIGSFKVALLVQTTNVRLASVTMRRAPAAQALNPKPYLWPPMLSSSGASQAARLSSAKRNWLSPYTPAESVYRPPAHAIQPRFCEIKVSCRPLE